MTRNTESTDERIDTAPVDDEVSPATEDGSADAVETDVSESPDDVTTEEVSPSAASAADLDDGTPESDADPESDASEADEVDEIASATPEASVAAASAVATAGPTTEDGSPHRRRRSDPPPEAPVAAPRRRGRAGWIAASIVLFLLLGAAVALDVHLWRTTDQWEARADELTEANYALGEELSSEQSTTMQLESEIDLLSQQLATSNQKVVDLSAEKASANDASAFANQQIDQLEGYLSQSTAVASAMQRCIDGHEQLAEYLAEPDNYEPEQLSEYASGVTQLCEAAKDSNEALRAELAG
ncbi:hypothetical protein [uncultured Demequina sp.]|uniref:hypothetical protein n=1 Tax=uncultured Demequina sp. TaxID=693499 RepID=UPI0025F68D75|nr:hypothetical protein [uncultured Demequina sp.]